MNTMYKSLVALLFLGIMACSGGEESKTATQDSDLPFVPLNDPSLQLIYTPTPNPLDEHKPIIDAINSAKVSVRMVMFILTDPEVVSALISAHQRIPTVQVILDQSNLSDPTSSNSKAYQELLAAGVNVMKSSTKFTLTHEKSMVIDDKR
ncbi:MAG: hypothetical protein HGA41_05755, partial [Syntrophaceae bacterium]|nr:hypothetical protein [Syntrophaceae bacterium]